MTIAELIEKLKDLPPTMVVMLDGEEAVELRALYIGQDEIFLMQ